MKVLIENPEGAVKVLGHFSHFECFKNDDTLCLYTDTVDEDDDAFIYPEEEEVYKPTYFYNEKTGRYEAY